MNYLRILPLLCAALLLVSCGEKESPNTLVVGMELAYPPFEMTDERNQPTGVSVDLAKSLGEYLGRPVRIQNISFDGLIPSLQTGKIDLIISSLTVTEKRAEEIAFSDPYVQIGLCLLVSKNSRIHEFSDIDSVGNSIAIKQSTTGHFYALDNLKQATLLPLESESSAVLEVVQGKADAFIYDQMSIYRHWQRHPQETRPLLIPFQKESWAIGLRKGQPELLEQINAFLATFRAKGGFDELGERYLGEEKKAFKELGFPFLF